MFTQIGRKDLIVVVNAGFNDDEAYKPARLVRVDPGQTGSNTVEVTDQSGAEIEHLTKQLLDALIGVGVVLTHDLIYQPNQWKYHVAARRVAKERPDIKWLHWVHSATDMGVREQTGPYQRELVGPFPNSKLVVMHQEERMRKLAAFGYLPHQSVIIPNPLDITEGYDPIARRIIEDNGLCYADVVLFYPCRLDRGKQPHILVEIAEGLISLGLDARVIIADFHSTAGDKAVYRAEMREQAAMAGVPLVFTSDYAEYAMPHQAVMDLFDFADVLVHPSKSESDPLILQEAMWKRCGLVLNFDLPLFRTLSDGMAHLFKFSSCVDVATGMIGETNTDYTDRKSYMKMIAGVVAYEIQNDPHLLNHARVRKERSLEAVWEQRLYPTLCTAGEIDDLGEPEQEARPSVSIVIPVYLLPDKDNELLRFTYDCMRSITEYMPYAEVIVVDNGSPVRSEALRDSACIYIRNDENLGFAPAVNQGLEAATEEWIIVCNNDVEFLHDWGRKAIGAWQPEIGIISSHLIDHDPQMSMGLEYPPDDVGYFFGACWMVRRDILDEIGYLDEGYKIGMYEDKDFVQRIVAAGYKTAKIGHVKHVGNATWGKMENQHEIYLQNKERYEAKWASQS